MSAVSRKEVEDTISSLEGDLAPDIDGSTSTLLKTSFLHNSPLTPYLVSMINYILTKGDVPQAWKSYYISLIEKKPGNMTVETMANDMRPISIINEFSKLISKILVTGCLCYF